MATVSGVTKGQVFRYVFMPEILPRIHAFTSSGFTNLAWLVAQVYAAINLLPRNHPIFMQGRGKPLSLRHVVVSAAQQLKFTRGHIDQVIVFFAVLVGMILLALQFILLLAFIMINPSFAQSEMPQNYADFFAEADQKNDIAYRMLFTVFGVPDLFKDGGARSEYHVALHSLFQLYSVGMLVIAAIIVCYYIFAVLAETAQTGVPFGKRYNHVWAPIRLVVGLGLLIPVGYGLNSAQWITLYTAKFGSDFATKGWVLFNETMNGEYLKKPEERVGTPKVPDVKNIPAFVMLALACEYAYETLKGGDMDIQAHPLAAESNATSPTPMPGSGGTAQDQGKKHIIYRIGAYDSDLNNNNPGNVFPYCGEIVILKTDREPGSIHMHKVYSDIIHDTLTGSGELQQAAIDMVNKYLEKPDLPEGKDPPNDFRETQIKYVEDLVKAGIDEAVTKQANSPTWKNDIADVKKYGWGGAGIWYNKIAQVNGSLATAVGDTPQIRLMPDVMEYIKKKASEQNRSVQDVFTDAMSNEQSIQYRNEDEARVARVLLMVYDYWSKEDRSQGPLSNQTKMTGNIIIDGINAIFGTQGLFAMCQNTDTHPLAQLSLLGKGLVEASIRNIMGGLGFGVAQLVFPGGIGAFMGAASGMLFSIASITIVMGFMLFYVMPFMPFLYFFFAVGGWIKGLFEAMVGMPLWAIAHLRIDGDGLPGSAGMDGYYLLFEIFIRPILIVFGLLASIIIFAAMVKVLNEIFHLVVQNLSGHDPNATTMCGAGAGTGGAEGGGGSNGGGTTTSAQQDPMEFFRGPIDELFYTVLYAIVVYMIGMSCFKLIDLIPNNILRYMGASVSTFNDKAADPADGLMSRLSIGGSMVSGKILGGAGDGGLIQSATTGLAGVGKGAIDIVTPKNNPNPSGG